MNERKMKNERNVNEKKEGEGRKPDKMLGVLNKMGVTPLKATIAAVATTAVLAAGCGSSLTTDKRDADEDVESDAPELVAQIPRPPLEAEIPMPRDSETDGDVTGDIADVTDEEVADVPEEGGVCAAVDGVFYGYIQKDASEEVGNVEITYKGSDIEGNAIFDISCDGVIAEGDVVAPKVEDTVVELSDGSTVTFRPFTATSDECYVSINVNE